MMVGSISALAVPFSTLTAYLYCSRPRMVVVPRKHPRAAAVRMIEFRARILDVDSFRLEFPSLRRRIRDLPLNRTVDARLQCPTGSGSTVIEYVPPWVLTVTSTIVGIAFLPYVVATCWASCGDRDCRNAIPHRHGSHARVRGGMKPWFVAPWPCPTEAERYASPRRGSTMAGCIRLSRFKSPAGKLAIPASWANMSCIGKANRQSLANQTAARTWVAVSYGAGLWKSSSRGTTVNRMGQPAARARYR